MSKELVSVIVPAYNTENYVLETLESIKKQSYPNWECIIVNDGSTDGTRDKIEAFINSDSRFSLINTNNGGVSLARNLAIQNSKGNYLFPLDSDDCIDSDCLARCVDEFARGKNIKLVYPEAVLFGNQEGRWELSPFDYKTMLKYNMVHNSSMFLRKDFDRVGGYRTNMIYGLEDWDFFIALLYGCTNEEVIKIKDPLFYYRTSNVGRGLKVAATGKQSEMLDTMVYNNFSIYREYYPDIFTRIQEYGYDKTMMNKKPVKMMVNLLNSISKIKYRILR